MTLLTVRLALVAACSGVAAYADARTHRIPDLAWVAAFVGAAVIAAIGGIPAWISGAGGALGIAIGFLPGVLVRRNGVPAFPSGDYLLAVSLGALAGDAAVPLAVLLVAGLGLAYGVGLVAVGAIQGRSVRDSLALRPAFAPVLALGFVMATAWPLVR